jgi:phenylalanyl-tRNA synthetase beta chain
MIISYQWLLEYLPEPLPVNELSNILTSIGLEVESVDAAESIKGGLEGLVIGEVLTCAKHPNADKLSVTTVNVGGAEPLHIVCGAPNVAAGQKVVVAPVGTTVHPLEGEPFRINKAKIRGEESAGMICAEDEIGLGSSHAGIIILPGEAVPGTLAKDYYNIPKTDYAIHIGLTPNRSDANSHIGVARDVCAYLTHHRGNRFVVRQPEINLKESSAAGAIKVNIQSPEACPRYVGISLRNIKVGPSPEWLQKRLQTIGVRSINNIVDITNYVLHESGQPLHAFDADKINGKEINVRFMPEGTAFMALDDKERKLRADDLAICDAEGPMAIGGVFGGKHSGINEGTTSVFIESAYFDPRHIRRTSLYHGLRTDAATHFEKGVDINKVIPALKRAAALITELAGGEVISGITDEYPVPLPGTKVTVSYQYIQKLSGKAYNHLAIQELLVASGFVIAHETREELTLNVPSNKTDVTEPADIVEEILRIDGLDNVQIPGRLNIAMTKALPNDRKVKERLAELLCGMGFQEIVTNSIVNSRYYPDRTDLVRMINSLSSELDVMRPSLLESGLEVVQYNCNRKNQNLCLFEYGSIYTHNDSKYTQEQRLGLWVTGDVKKAHWDQKAQAANIYHLKGIIANLLGYSGVTGIKPVYKESENEIEWRWKNQVLCVASQIPAARLNKFDIKQAVFFADIHWDVWVKAAAAGKVQYKEVPKFPAVLRDLAIVIDSKVTYKQVEEVTDQLKLDGLQSYGLFDVFESEKLGAGKKSYALNYTFQLQDRTLTDTETEQLMKRLMDVYKNKLGALIRE